MKEIIDEVKLNIRDINLDMISKDVNIDIDVSKRYDKKFQIWFPNRRLIKYVTEIGGVLTGSRAIRCYTINGKQFINRKINDWDFIITKEMAYKISQDMKIPYNLVDKVISIKREKYWAHPSYEDSYRVGPVDVNLIIEDKLDNYNDINGVRISNFNYCLNKKIKLIEKLKTKIEDLKNTYVSNNNTSIDSLMTEMRKHIGDLTQIIIKYNLNNKN